MRRRSSVDILSDQCVFSPRSAGTFYIPSISTSSIRPTAFQLQHLRSRPRWCRSSVVSETLVGARVIGTILLENHLDAVCRAGSAARFGGVQLTVYALILMAVILWRPDRADRSPVRNLRGRLVRRHGSGGGRSRVATDGRSAGHSRSQQSGFGGPARGAGRQLYGFRKTKTVALIGPKRRRQDHQLSFDHRVSTGPTSGLGVGLWPRDHRSQNRTTICAPRPGAHFFRWQNRSAP